MLSDYDQFIRNKEYLGLSFSDIVQRNDPKEIVKLGTSLMESLAKQLGMKQDGLIVYDDKLMICFGLHLFSLVKIKTLGKERRITDYNSPKHRSCLTIRLNEEYYYIPVELIDIKTEKEDKEVDTAWKMITSPINDNFDSGKSSYKLLMESVVIDYKSDYDLSLHKKLININNLNQESYKKFFKEKYQTE